MNNKLLPPLERQIILAHILKKSREYVLAHPEIRLTGAQKTRFDKLIKRRLHHEPMAYILGRKGFYGLDFKVNKNTLIPRPETELLVEEALKKIRDTKYQIPYTIIDIGTGSGNIIISIAKNSIKYQVSNIKYFGIDISSKALSVAKHNAKKHCIDKKIRFIKSNLLDFLIRDTRYKIQDTILVANLPYLSEEIYGSAMPDVKDFEPKSALLSRNDGLNHYDRLLQQIKTLKEKCSMLHVSCHMEISPEQKSKITNLIKKYFPRANIEFRKDLSGRWRLASFQH